MAEKILIMGESGTGKSTSLRNFDPSEVAVVNPVGKPLPFKGGRKFESLDAEVDSRKIIKFMQQTKKKVIVVDDFQYLLSIPYMNRIKEAGWDKWNDFASNYFDIIDVCQDLAEDVTVYFMTHVETLESGVTTIKLIGKLLREKITIEGLFTTVLRTLVTDGKYYFVTQNSGKDTVKSPMGMFPSYAIDNDLKYVDEKLRNYYEIGEFKSDEEIVELDDQAKTDLEKPNANGRRSRGGKAEESEPPKTEEKSPRSRRNKTEEQVAVKTNSEASEGHRTTEDTYVFHPESDCYFVIPKGELVKSEVWESCTIITKEECEKGMKAQQSAHRDSKQGESAPEQSVPAEEAPVESRSRRLRSESVDQTPEVKAEPTAQQTTARTRKPRGQKADEFKPIEDDQDIPF